MKRLVGLLLITGLLAVLAGCSGSTTGNSASNTNPTDTKPKEPPKGTVPPGPK